jgi:hypothetical protein
MLPKSLMAKLVMIAGLGVFAAFARLSLLTADEPTDFYIEETR